MKRIGIIGGSFNPIHIAHLIIADRFVDQMQLDVCMFVPAYQSPFKQATDVIALPEHRLEMVRLATLQHPHFLVSDVEIRRGGVSYSVDTITHLRNQYPEAHLSLLVGSDQALEFDRWHRWQEIANNACICIVKRPFLLTAEIEQRVTNKLTVDGRAPVWIEAPLLEVSSTDIRKRVLESKSINYLTVKAVRDYISTHGLYAAPRNGK